MEMGMNIMSILRILLVVVGIISAAWGIYDLFSDNSAQSGGAIKKIIGGLAFAIIIYFVMSWAMNEIGRAGQEAGMTTNTSYSITAAVENPPQLLNG